VREKLRDGGERGEPVAWIELVSPSNKPGSSDFAAYEEKRRLLLRGGVVFVEMDYLHESPPTFEGIAIYSRRRGQPPQPGSHPYRITVIDPRPDVWQGQGRSRQFDVDEPIPPITIPLNGDDVLKFDFNPPYQKTFAEMLYGDEVDYRQLPANFEAYSPDDQARIVNRMLAVLEAARDGRDLESGPFPASALPLDEALAQFETHRSTSI
jgi:hypothetical protein